MADTTASRVSPLAAGQGQRYSLRAGPSPVLMMILSTLRSSHEPNRKMWPDPVQ